MSDLYGDDLLFFDDEDDEDEEYISPVNSRGFTAPDDGFIESRVGLVEDSLGGAKDEGLYDLQFHGVETGGDWGIRLDRLGRPYIGSDPTDPNFQYKDNFEYDQFFDLDRVLEVAILAGASDVHIHANRSIRFTVNKDIIPVYLPDVPPPTVQALEIFTEQDISSLENEEFSEYRELDASYVILNSDSDFYGRRFRLSMGRSMTEVFLVLRVVNDEIPSVTDLGISGELLRWTELPNGLIMVNGPTGTGKSTTLASMLRRIQLSYPKKIITLEKPIEYVYGEFDSSLVTQRQIGMDSISFSNALDGAMRQHPNIIMVGEVRNNTEVEALLRSAESGHLTISTMHTNNAAATLNRIKSLFSGDEQSRVLSTMADVSRGFANQVLLKKQGGGLFAVREILTVDGVVKDLIGKGDVASIEKYQIEHKITMEHELYKAFQGGLCSFEEAEHAVVRPLLFKDIVAGKV